MIHATLKQATQDLHRQTEKRLQVLFDPALTLDQYTRVLTQLYGFYRPLEDVLLSIDWDDPEIQMPNRRKLPLLRNDLSALGENLDSLQQLDCCDSLPELNTVAEGLGCLYVLEGSTLGGQFISRQLKNVLRINDGLGLQFFNSYGEHTARNWANFLKLLERHCERHETAEVVVRSACQTFASIDQWLSHAA